MVSKDQSKEVFLSQAEFWFSDIFHLIFVSMCVKDDSLKDHSFSPLNSVLKAVLLDCTFQFILSLFSVYTRILITDPISLFYSPSGYYFSYGSSTVTKVSPLTYQLQSWVCWSLTPYMNSFMFLPPLLNSVKALNNVLSKVSWSLAMSHWLKFFIIKGHTLDPKCTRLKLVKSSSRRVMQ